MRVAHMPPAEIEIGEQEHNQRRGDGRLDAGAPDSLGGVLEAEHFFPEAEVDANVSEDRPRKSRRSRKDHRPPNDEHDRQEQRQKPGNADQNALVEGQAG